MRRALTGLQCALVNSIGCARGARFPRPSRRLFPCRTLGGALLLVLLLQQKILEMGFKLCDLFYQHIVELERAGLAQYHQPATRQLRGGSRQRDPIQARSDTDSQSRGACAWRSCESTSHRLAGAGRMHLQASARLVLASLARNPACRPAPSPWPAVGRPGTPVRHVPQRPDKGRAHAGTSAGARRGRESKGEGGSVTWVVRLTVP